MKWRELIIAGRVKRNCRATGAKLKQTEIIQVYVVVAMREARLRPVEALATHLQQVADTAEAHLPCTEIRLVHVVIIVHVGERVSTIWWDVSHVVRRVIQVEPADVLAPGVAAEPPGGKVEAGLLPVRAEGRASVKVHSADIFAPSQPEQIAGRRINVHREVGRVRRVVVVADPVGRRAAPKTDPAGVF